MIVKKLKITGLFHKYNISVDFTRKLNVLIGANGIGKSTILKIVNALQNEDFVELSKYEFDSLETITDIRPDYEYKISETEEGFFFRNGNEIIFHIRQEDLFPERDALKRAYQLYYFAISSPLLEEPDDMTKELLPSIDLLIDELYDSRVIFRIITDIALNIPLGYELKNGLEKRVNELKIEKEFYTPLISSFPQHLVRADEKSSLRLFIGSAVASIWPFFGIDLRHNILYFDLVKEIVFPESGLPKPLWGSKFFRWLRALENTKSGYWNSVVEELTDPDYDDSSEYILKIPYNIYKKDTGKLILSIYKDLAGKTYDIEQCISQEEDGGDLFIKEIYPFMIDRFMATRKYDINLLITRSYYADDFVDMINKKAVEYCSRIAKGELAYNRNNPRSHVPEVAEALKKRYQGRLEIVSGSLEEALSQYFLAAAQDIVDYIMPVLCKDLILTPSEILSFYEPSYSILRRDVMGFSDGRAYICFRFYESILDELMDRSNRSVAVERLEFLLQKYLYDKQVKILPSGLKITIRSDSEQESKLSLNNLASGEKKIIVLLSAALLMNDISIMIDEPELSLSIVWQETILPDILENSNIHNLTIATHSPYLVSKRELYDSMVFMPDDKS